jgi:hypothetical protein
MLQLSHDIMISAILESFQCLLAFPTGAQGGRCQESLYTLGLGCFDHLFAVHRHSHSPCERILISKADLAMHVDGAMFELVQKAVVAGYIANLFRDKYKYIACPPTCMYAYPDR